MGHPITESDVSQAIQTYDVNITIQEVDDLLVGIQEDIEDEWDHWLSTIEHGDLTLRAQTEDALILQDSKNQFWPTEFDVLMDFTNLMDQNEIPTQDIVLAAHLHAARRLTDKTWKTENPVILTPPEDCEGLLSYASQDCG